MQTWLESSNATKVLESLVHFVLSSGWNTNSKAHEASDLSADGLSGNWYLVPAGALAARNPLIPNVLQSAPDRCEMFRHQYKVIEFHMAMPF